MIQVAVLLTPAKKASERLVERYNQSVFSLNRQLVVEWQSISPHV
ncbi:MAG: hypothetical protein V7K68_21005 [Nostoc sp.]